MVVMITKKMWRQVKQCGKYQKMVNCFFDCDHSCMYMEYISTYPTGGVVHKKTHIPNINIIKYWNILKTYRWVTLTIKLNVKKSHSIYYINMIF